MIFVCIASYADPELPSTLRDCLDNARHPDDLRFGICWQGDPQAPIPLDAFRSDSRFRFADFTIAESEGGTWARSVAQTLWDGEEFTLQVDSHMKFEPDWDVKLMAMLAELPCEKPLLTVNSPLFWYDAAGELHREFERGVPTSRINHWSAEVGWAPWAVWGPPNEKFPAHNRIITGNFVFTLGRWHEEVPQDPEHYYWGEEFNLTVRSFTAGYDLYVPREIVAWHMCHFDGGPRRHWEKGRGEVERKSAVALERLRKLLYVVEDSPDAKSLGRYGLGSVRSRRDYEVFSGFDFARKRAHPDVFTGRPPDPVTIRCDADWDRCITIEEAFARNPSLAP